MLALIAALSLGQYAPYPQQYPAYPQQYPQQPYPQQPYPQQQYVAPQPTPASEREVAIRAVREELTELRDQRSGAGYVLPSIFIIAGITLCVLGTTLQLDSTLGWLRVTLLMTGAATTSAAGFWLLSKIAKAVALGNKIDLKEEQLHALETARLNVSMMLVPGGAMAALSARF